MRPDKLTILIVLAAVVAAVVAFYVLDSGQPPAAPADSEPATPPAVATAPQPPATQGTLASMPAEKFRGISLQLQNGQADHSYKPYIDEIAAAGANTICLVVSAFQENCASTSIFVDLRKAPSDETLKDLIRYAHSLHMRVVLMPIVLLENPREGEWRGKIAPGNWDDWWEDYTNYIMRYAWIAEEAGVDVYLVGSELVSTELQVQRWRDLIARARTGYHGLLGYSANWDHYRPVQWWDALDIVGMTTYYDLTAGKAPTVENLVEAWKPIKTAILEWQRQVNRPILFTEVGWPNQTTCGQYPWDYYRSTSQPDPQAQANCFEAFFRTWADEPAVAGYLVWEWRNRPDQVIDPKHDTSYVPAGKPAMAVISRYLRGLTSPAASSSAATASSPTGSTGPAGQ